MPLCHDRQTAELTCQPASAAAGSLQAHTVVWRSSNCIDAAFKSLSTRRRLVGSRRIQCVCCLELCSAHSAACARRTRAVAMTGIIDDVSLPKVKLVGFANFVRSNPRADRFDVLKFHHIEFWCGDATNTYKRCVLCETHRK